MTRNLNLSGGIRITSSDSNVSFSHYDLPASSKSGFTSSDMTTGKVYNSNSTDCSSNVECYSYYNYTAATAGTNPSSGTANSDICPKGWRLPTEAELSTVKSYYSSSTNPFRNNLSGWISSYSVHSGAAYTTYYWLSNAESDSKSRQYMSGLSILSSSKSYGQPMRCIKK